MPPPPTLAATRAPSSDATRAGLDAAGVPDPDGPAGTCTIAEAAERTGVSTHTLRYYERAGLIDVGRDHNDRRRYTDRDLGRVTFITRMRQSEMPVRDILRYVELVREGPHTEPQRLAIMTEHRADVVRRLAELTAALAVIDFKITVYGGAAGEPARSATCTPAATPDPTSQPAKASTS